MDNVGFPLTSEAFPTVEETIIAYSRARLSGKEGLNSRELAKFSDENATMEFEPLTSHSIGDCTAFLCAINVIERNGNGQYKLTQNFGYALGEALRNNDLSKVITSWSRIIESSPFLGSVFD